MRTRWNMKWNENDNIRLITCDATTNNKLHEGGKGGRWIGWWVFHVFLSQPADQLFYFIWTITYFFCERNKIHAYRNLSHFKLFMLSSFMFQFFFSLFFPLREMINCAANHRHRRMSTMHGEIVCQVTKISRVFGKLSPHFFPFSLAFRVSCEDEKWEINRFFL